MNIVELIKHLKSESVAQELISKELPGVESCLVDIYLLKELSLTSQVVFFDLEEIDAIPNRLVMEIEGNIYVNLFPFEMAQEMVEAYINDNEYGEVLSDLEIAKRLLEYREKDA